MSMQVYGIKIILQSLMIYVIILIFFKKVNLSVEQIERNRIAATSSAGCFNVTKTLLIQVIYYAFINLTFSNK